VKVLYIGHYREGTGWAQAAINYILALDAVGVDVVCRPVKLNNTQPELPPRILELESKSSRGCTVCIQHVLPHYMDYNSGFLNVGMAILETSSIKHTSWATRLNNMDQVWVPDTSGFNACKNSGITKPLYQVPHACDLNRYKEYEPINLNLNDEYVFYFIGEHVRRKHLSALIQAFHVEFDTNDNVALVIKSHKSGLSSEECYNRIKQTADMIKNNLRKYTKHNRYHPEHVITDHISEEQLMGLHQRGNCFVMPSFGEAWNIPAFDAMAMGNQVLSSNIGGMRDYLKCGSLVGGRMEPVVGADMVFEDLNTCRENWYNISPLDLQDSMRSMYQSRPVMYDKDWVGRYSYESIGNIMLENLNGHDVSVDE